MKANLEKTQNIEDGGKESSKFLIFLLLQSLGLISPSLMIPLNHFSENYLLWKAQVMTILNGFNLNQNI